MGLASRAGEPVIPSGILKELTGRSCNQDPRTITGYTTLPQYKPFRITTTGDGSGFYGGQIGHNVVPPSGRATNQLGRLKWTRYNSNEANAKGVEWVKFGTRSLAQDSYRIDATIRIHLYRPRYLQFTRMTVIYGSYHGSRLPGRRVYRFKAQNGYWAES